MDDDDDDDDGDDCVGVCVRGEERGESGNVLISCFF